MFVTLMLFYTSIYVAIKFSMKGGQIIVTVEPYTPTMGEELLLQNSMDANHAPNSAGDGNSSVTYNNGSHSPSHARTSRHASDEHAFHFQPTGLGQATGGNRSGLQMPGLQRDASNSSLRPTRLSLPPSQLPCQSASDGAKEYTYLKFSVQDFGVGIPKSKQHRLFHAFSQVDASDTRKYGGEQDKTCGSTVAV